MSTADIDSETVIRLVSDAVTAILTRLQSKFGIMLSCIKIVHSSELNSRPLPHLIGKSLCMSVLILVCLAISHIDRSFLFCDTNK